MESARTKRSLRVVLRNDTQFRKQPKFSDGANASCNAKCLPKIRRRIPQAGQADRRDYYAAVATVVAQVILIISPWPSVPDLQASGWPVELDGLLSWKKLVGGLIETISGA